ncbi:MAG TPA: hypothetical protein DDW52_06835 [Planctomycetaceae bacterium]|nr:hypothetical protein [Planctomycetaceae bacterium]
MKNILATGKIGSFVGRSLLSAVIVVGFIGDTGRTQQESTAISIDGSTDASRIWREGWSYYKNGDLEKALGAYMRAFDLAQSNVILAQSATALAFQLKDKQKMLEIWSAHIGARPKSSGGYRGNHELQNTELELEAASDFVKTIESRRRRLAEYLEGPSCLRRILCQRVAFVMKSHELVWRDVPSHSALKGYPSGIQLKDNKMHLWISNAGNGQMQYSYLVFELLNAESYDEIVRVTDLARSGEVQREEFILRLASYEHKTQLRLRCFFALTKCDALSFDADWRIGVPPDFGMYMSQFKKDAEYPYEFFGRMFDTL